MSAAAQIVILILYVVLIVGTGHIAYAYGVKCGAQTERLMADRRVRGVLAGKRNTVGTTGGHRPPLQKKKKARMIKVGEVSVPALIVKTSKRS